MAYSIDNHQDLTEIVRCVAREQVNAAIANLQQPRSENVVSTVHDSRKRCKKLRGLVRLVRPSLGAKRYTKANSAFRDAARALSDHRDAQALLATFDRLVAAAADELPTEGLGEVRRELLLRQEASTGALGGQDERIDRANLLLALGRDQIDEWTLHDDGWLAVRGGLAKTYGRGVDALGAATMKPNPERYHELRKRAKYTWYHVRLLEQTAPSVLRPLASSFHDLSDGLGDAHDLAVLSSQLRTEPDAFGGQGVVDAATVFIDGHRVTLERRSIGLAARLYAESPKRFTKRMGGYWHSWEAFGAEEEVGEIGAFPTTASPAEHRPLEQSAVDEQSDGLDELKVVELRKLAREVDLPGRSSKQRDELIKALRARGVDGT